MASEAGKGDKRRPTDQKAFEANHSAVFGEKPVTRGSFVWCSEQKKMVPKDEYYANHQTNEAAMIINDIQPYKSMIDGSIITSRSHHRTHLRDHGCIEVGNEKQTVKAPSPPEGRKESILRAAYQHGLIK